MAGNSRKKVAVVAIHGMGRTDRKYADEFRKALFTRLGDKGDALHIGAIYYQDLLDPNEDRLWKAVSGKFGLRPWGSLRKFVLYFLGDAAALETRKSNSDGPYTGAQIAIAKELLSAYKQVGPASPVVFVAHSLGGQVLSNYLWDAQKHREEKQVTVGIWRNPDKFASQISPDGNLTKEQKYFIEGASIRFLYTIGCNIPLFMAGHPKESIEAIDKRQMHPQFRWHNFYDKDDVLGWPLKDLSSSYERLVADHEVNAARGFLGWLFKSWNPLSHNQYWCDDKVLDHLQGNLDRLLQRSS